MKTSTMYVTGVLEREEGDRDKKKVYIWRNDGQKLPICGESHKFTDSRSLKTSKQDNFKENLG